MKTSVIIVFELVPEESQIFVEDVDEEMLMTLRASHGYFGGAANTPPDVEAGIDQIGNWLASRAPDYSTNEKSPTERSVDVRNAVELFHTGWLL